MLAEQTPYKTQRQGENVDDDEEIYANTLSDI